MHFHIHRPFPLTSVWICAPAPTVILCGCPLILTCAHSAWLKVALKRDHFVCTRTSRHCTMSVRCDYVSLIDSQQYSPCTIKTLNRINFNHAVRNWRSWWGNVMIIGLESEVSIQKIQESRQEHQQKIKAMGEPVSVGRKESAINGMQQRTVNKRRRSVRHDEKQTWKMNAQILSGSKTADEKTTGKIVESKVSQRLESVREEISKTVQRQHQWKLHEPLVWFFASTCVSESRK